jgi:hypothetical protein
MMLAAFFSSAQLRLMRVPTHRLQRALLGGCVDPLDGPA